MGLTRNGLILAACIMFAGCGHGFHGDYKIKVESANDHAQDMIGGLAGNEKLEIGPDYIESDGEKTVFDEVFFRESGHEKFLVFKNDESEKAWKIVDKKTLTREKEAPGLGDIKVKLEKQVKEREDETNIVER